MKYLLLLLTLDATNGEPRKLEPLETFDEPEACLAATLRPGPQKASDGVVTVMVCAREKSEGLI